MYQSDNKVASELQIFMDLDWASDWINRKSISGFVVIFEREVVS